MWDELKQIALLGSSKSQLNETQIDLLKRFGINTTRQKSLVVLDALALWNKMKAVGTPCEAWTDSTNASSGTRAQFASANISNQIGVMLKYKGYEKLLPEVFNKLLANDTNFPAEHLPKLMLAMKNDSSLFFKIKESLDDRFYWLANQHPIWKIYCSEDPEIDFKQTKIVEIKKQILLMWLHKNQAVAIQFLTQETDKISHELWNELLIDFIKHEPELNNELKSLLEIIHSHKSKQSYGITCILLMKYSDSDFAMSIAEYVSKVLIVSKDSIDVIENEIDKLKTLLPKSFLPFNSFKSREKIFDKNLFYHALAITSPEILFSKYFKMNVDDFLNTVSHLSFYDELIIQAMIYSAAAFQHKDLLNGLIKIFRSGEFHQCNWKPILDLLPPKGLNGELNRILKDENYEFDHRMVHLFFAKNFEWPAKAVAFYSNLMADQLDQQKLGKRDLFYQLFEQMILKCNPHFYYDLKSQLVTDRVFSFHSNSLIEKQLKILKLRLEFEKEVRKGEK